MTDPVPATRPHELTRRSLIGRTAALAAGLVLAACGDESERQSAAQPSNDSAPEGLNGVRVDVWRDPG